MYNERTRTAKSARGMSVNSPEGASESTFAERLKHAIGKKSMRAFSIDTGISYGAMHKYCSGTTLPTLDNLVLLAEHSGVDLEWLATGKGSPDDYVVHHNSNNIARCYDIHGNAVNLDNFVFVPYYHTAHLNEGLKQPKDQASSGSTAALRREWIEEHLRIDPKNVAAFNIEGNSMLGHVDNSDIVIIDYTDTNPKEGIYAINIGSHILVKQLQRLPDSFIKVSAANPIYESFTVNLNNPPDDFKILGKVLWCGHQI